MKAYDLVVIGLGPVGRQAAFTAAEYGYSVAVVEHPSFLDCEVDRLLQNPSFLNDTLGVESSMDLATTISGSTLKHLDIEMIWGQASFVDAHTVQVQNTRCERICGKKIFIATGSCPSRPEEFLFDGETTFDSHSISNINRIPRSLLIVGAGVVGVEYAVHFASLGSKVKLVNSEASILPFIDCEMRLKLMAELENQGVELLLKTTVDHVNMLPEWCEERVQSSLSDGGSISSECLLYAAGRQSNSHHLNLSVLDICTGERGEIPVDTYYRTAMQHIYAIGDVVGYPIPVNLGVEQGAYAVAHAFGHLDPESPGYQFPLGVNIKPGVSFCGKTEKQLQEAGVDYFVGRAYYKNMPQGQELGGDDGFIKLIFDTSTQDLLGVHIWGEAAKDLIHYGMMLLNHKAGLSDLVNRVFPSPVPDELYKYAAYNGLIEEPVEAVSVAS